MAPDYSIIVPAYNEETFLPATLARLNDVMVRVNGHQGEIIVTDNNSTDRTADVARCLGARVVFEPDRQIARCRNAGAKASHGRYLVFVDADTLISTALLSGALEALDSDRYCGGGALIAVSPDIGFAASSGLKLWNRLSRTCKWACGSFVFCRRDAFFDVAGFDERYYASEEIHLSRALKQWGRRNGFDFLILDETLETSLRKFEWFSTGQIVLLLLKLAVCPFLLRSRRACHFWYDRPEIK